MKKYAVLVWCLIMFSCKNTPKRDSSQPVPVAIRTGLYKSKKPGYLEWINLRSQGIKGYAKGSEINLKPDSTYEMLTCGTVSKGRWYTDSSRLYLKEEYVNWRLDTFKKHGFKGHWPEVSKAPLVFIIKKDVIYQVWKNIIDMMEFSKDKPTPLDGE